MHPSLDKLNLHPSPQKQDGRHLVEHMTVSSTLIHERRGRNTPVSHMPVKHAAVKHIMLVSHTVLAPMRGTWVLHAMYATLSPLHATCPQVGSDRGGNPNPTRLSMHVEVVQLHG